MHSNMPLVDQHEYSTSRLTCMFPTSNVKSINFKNYNDNSCLLHKKETQFLSTLTNANLKS